MTIVVDVANVMGSRPDGWWRDRAGAAARLHAQITELAASGRAILPGEDNPPGQPDGSHLRGQPGEEHRPGHVGENAPAFVLVLEGAARAAVPRLAPASRPASTTSEAAGQDAAAEEEGTARPGEVRVVEARGSGDDAIVAVVRELPGRRVVVTADRELRARCAAAGAEILGPGWLLGLLRDQPGSRARKGFGPPAT